MSVTLTLTDHEAAHLTWLLSTGHTRTPWLTDLIARLNNQIPADKQRVNK